MSNEVPKAVEEKYLPSSVTQKMFYMRKRVQDLTKQFDKLKKDLKKSVDIIQEEIEEHVLNNWHVYDQHPETVELKDREEVEYKQYIALVRKRNVSNDEAIEDLEISAVYQKLQKWGDAIDEYEMTACTQYVCMPVNIDWDSGKITVQNDDDAPEALDLDLDALEASIEEAVAGA